jgi:hypothetical protein
MEECFESRIDFEDSVCVVNVSGFHRNQGMAVFTSKEDHRKSWVVNVGMSWLEDYFRPAWSYMFPPPPKEKPWKIVPKLFFRDDRGPQTERVPPPKDRDPHEYWPVMFRHKK